MQSNNKLKNYFYPINKLLWNLLRKAAYLLSIKAVLSFIRFKIKDQIIRNRKVCSKRPKVK